MRPPIRVLFAFGLAVVLHTVVASSAHAQLTSTSPIVVVDVSTEQTKIAVVSARTFNEAMTRKPVAAGEGSPLDRVMSACTPTEQTAAESRSDEQLRAALKLRLDLLTDLKNCVECLKAHQETRYVTNRGQDVALIVLFADPIKEEHLRPFFREEPRDSELVATAKALAKLVRESVGLDCRAFTYTLQRKRSRLKITMTGLPAGAASASPSAPAPAAAIETDPPPAAAGATAVRPDVITPELVLGPIEHWFLSADFSFSASDIQLGTTPEVDESKLEKKDFFVGVNFSIGDLLADRESAVQRRSFWKEIVIKAQLTPSTEPWEAWAVGVGVRGYRIRTILWNMDVVHPYFTFGRQKTDEEETPRWRAVFGVGFDPRSLKK
jgi:hypothetical protein